MEPDTVGDFDEMIDDVIEDGDIVVGATELGIGISAHLGELTTIESPDGSIERLFIQFFANCVLPGTPADTSCGYTDDDVTTTTGVIVVEVGSDIYPPRYVGEAIPVEQFLEEFSVGPDLTRKIDGLMDSLVQQATPDEGWLEKLSSLYHERLPGNISLEKLQRMC
jgi:hypothetical protein